MRMSVWAVAITMAVGTSQSAPEPLAVVPPDATTRVSIDPTSVFYVASRAGALRLLSRPVAPTSAPTDHELYRAPPGMVVLSPALAPGGRRLYFETNERRPSVAGREDTDVWFVERSGQTWSTPRPLGTPFNTPYNEHSPTADATGTICFNSSRPGSEENDIYCGQVGASSPPERQATLSSAAEDATPWLSADGHLIVFTSNRPGGLGGWDLYISRKVGGRWAAPRNLAAPINSSADEVAVSLSSSGDDLYFFRPADASRPRRGYRVRFTDSVSAVARR